MASRKLRQTARRNVRTQTAPQRNQIDRSELQSNQDYLGALQAARSAYGGFQHELQQGPHFPLQQLAGQLQDQLGQFHQALGGTPEGVPSEIYGQPVGLPSSEAGAGTAAYSQLGDNAFNTLTNDAARSSMYRQSAGREGNLAERYARENLIQDLQNREQGFDQSRQQLADMMPGMISSEMDRLIQQHQADAQNRALSDYLQNYISSMAQGGGGRGGGGKPGGRRKHHQPQGNAANPNPGQGGHDYWTGEPTGQVMAPGATPPQPTWDPNAPAPVPGVISTPDTQPVAPGVQGPSRYPMTTNDSSGWDLPPWLHNFLWGSG